MRHQVGVKAVKRIGKFVFCRDGPRWGGGIRYTMHQTYISSFLHGGGPHMCRVYLHVRERKLTSNAWCIFSLDGSLGPLSPFFLKFNLIFYTYFIYIYIYCGRTFVLTPNQVLFALGYARIDLRPTHTNLLNPTPGKDASHPCLISLWPKEGWEASLPDVGLSKFVRVRHRLILAYPKMNNT